MLKSVLLVTIGGVAGQCGGRAPIVGRLGVRLFCGLGANSVACPAGSLCELPAGFCCPAPTVTPVTPPTTPTNVVEKKCPIGSPWKNELGVEFDCGPGLNHVDCPAGSECIVGLNNVFHACCALPGATPPAASGSQSIAGSVITTSVRPLSTDTMATDTMATDTMSTDTMSTDTMSTDTMSTDTMSTETKSTDTIPIETENVTETETEKTEIEIIEDSTVRFLTIRLLDPTEAIAMWAPPNGTDPESYIAEISYDGTEWRKLSLEEEDSTFITFPVTEKKDFHIRVAPEGGSPLEEFFSFQKKGKAGKILAGKKP